MSDSPYFNFGKGSSSDPAGKAHTASPGALTFGSPNFKMLPEPLGEYREWSGLEGT